MERGKHRTLVASLAGGLWMLLIVGLSFAAEEAPPPAGSEPPKVEAPASAPAAATAAAPAPKIDKGDTAWMLTSSALVLMMTAPGLALFYGGLVRRKNGLATIMQSFVLMAFDQRAVGPVGVHPCFRSGSRGVDRRS